MSGQFYEFYCPVKIVAGFSALDHLPFELNSRDCHRPLVVTDKGVRTVGLLDIVLKSLTEAGIKDPPVFDSIPPDSSTAIVADAARLYRQSNCDSIIAIGGGSVIDTSKGLNILVSEGGDDLNRFSGAGALKHPLRPLAVIPTTAGTGSEVTMVAVIADRERGVKLAFASPYLLPTWAVIDPRMTQSLPPLLTAATAMDALTHSVEAFTCLGKNPVSDAYASAAIRKISIHLPKVLDNPGDLAGRFELAQAATMAGIAFSNSMCGLVHAIGHQLGALCHLHHGACMSLILPYVLEYNLAARGDALGELLLYLEGPDVYARTPALDRSTATIRSIRKLRDQLHAKCGLPRTLSETAKVREDQLETLARMALDDGSLSYNPEEAEFDDVLGILKKAWA